MHFSNKDFPLLKRVQHRATKLIPSLRILNYEERLQALDLTTLSQRRQRKYMIQIFKIFHRMDKMEMGSEFMVFPAKSISQRRNSQRFSKHILIAG